jgi:O-antigen ligase
MIGVVLVVRTYLDAYTEDFFYIEGVRVSAAAVFTLAMILLIVMAFLASHSSISRSDGAKGLTLLVLGALVAVFTGYGRLGTTGNVGLREITRLLTLLIWYIFLYGRARQSGDEKPLFRAILLASAIPLVMGFVDLFTGTQFDAEGATRIASTFVNPNSYGTYLMFLIVFAFARVSSKNDWVGRLLLCLALPSLMFTYSRGAWIALSVAAPIYWMWMSKRRVRVGVIFLIVVLVGYPILGPRLAAVDYGDVLKEAQTGMTSNSFSFRLMIWKELLKLWTIHPILGWGLASTPTINPIRLAPDNKGYAAHNDMVRHLVETGLVGFSCYLYFLWSFGRTLFRRARHFKGSELGPYALAAFAIHIAIVVESSTVGDPLMESSFMFHFLGLAAILEGISDYRLGREGEVRLNPLPVSKPECARLSV